MTPEDRSRAARLAGIVLVLWLVVASLLVLVPAPSSARGPGRAVATKTS